MVDEVRPPTVAYFSMEVGIDASLPTYSGGLGVLAADSLRAAADLGVPMVGVTLLCRKGYFRQHLDAKGNQSEEPVDWDPKKYLEPVPTRASVVIEGREVRMAVWKYSLPSKSGSDVVVYFLDTAVPENSSWDQTLTDYLYGGDEHYRLCQEAVLGLGGFAVLRSLGYRDVEAYHLNEGHAALLTLALLAEESLRTGLKPSDKQNTERVRDHCVFTTHTPVPAGIDKFPFALARQVLGEEMSSNLASIDCLDNGFLNMNFLALWFSRYVNGVSMRHEEISRDMFPKFPINSITNGVHAVTWTCDAFRRLYDRHIPEWRGDNLYLRYAISIPPEEIRQAHFEAKQELLVEVKRRARVKLNPSVMTLGFARRMTAYKRPELLFFDLERLKKMAREVGPLQVLYAGKAHPRDEAGKALIRHVFEAAEALKGVITVVYLEEYDMVLAKYLCSGVDVWLNTPHKPYEASGTSGMKAALNGVPSLSILDGWWIEGHVEGVTGWSIGDTGQTSYPAKEAASLYDKLENVVIPMFYRQPTLFDAVMRYAIALNASYYNAQRMILQYLSHAYMPDH